MLEKIGAKLMAPILEPTYFRGWQSSEGLIANATGTETLGPYSDSNMLNSDIRMEVQFVNFPILKPTVYTWSICSPVSINFSVRDELIDIRMLEPEFPFMEYPVINNLGSLTLKEEIGLGHLRVRVRVHEPGAFRSGEISVKFRFF
jgi:hypothetical protein